MTTTYRNAPTSYNTLNEMLDAMDDYVTAAQQAARKGQDIRDVLRAISDLHDQVGLALGHALDLL